MAELKNIFLDDSKIAFDKKYRRTINFNISRYEEAEAGGRLRYKNLELAKQRTSYVKDNVFAKLDRKYLDLVNGTIKNQLVKANKNVLGTEKEFPAFVKNSFSKTWKLNLKS